MAERRAKLEEVRLSTPVTPAAIAGLELGNSIGMGPMGFTGRSMVVDCHIEIAYTHTGALPISVHSFCLSSRRAVARLHGDRRIEYRTDPRWFTDYHRREGIA